VIIRNMTQADMREVVAIHQTAFSGFFLDEMGPLFVERYYKEVLLNCGSIALVAVDDVVGLVGFATGFIDPDVFYSRLRNRFYVFTLGIIVGLIRRPRILIRVVNNIMRVNKSAGKSLDANCCELSSIAVNKKGAGVGSKLLQAFIKEAFEKAATTIRLTTDAESNDDVHSFYRNHGFVVNGVEFRNGRAMSIFSYKHLDI
jgi:ribosomal protein S18 acetylase RimI-like enzyme